MSFLGLEGPKESPTKTKKVQLQEKHPENADGLKVCGGRAHVNKVKYSI